MRFSAIPESDEKTSESPARPTRMSETPKTSGKTRRRSLDRRTPMRKSLIFREGAEYLSAEERKRRNKLLQDRMYLMKYESELTKVTLKLYYLILVEISFRYTSHTDMSGETEIIGRDKNLSPFLILFLEKMHQFDIESGRAKSTQYQIEGGSEGFEGRL